MQFTYTGQSISDNEFFDNATFDGNGEFDPNVDVFSPTLIQLTNPLNGWITTFGGSNFALDGNGEPATGTITSYTISNGSSTVASITGIAWGLVAFVDAIDEISDNDNDVPIRSILNSSGPVTVDASGAGHGYDMFAQFDVDTFTQPMTIIGSSFGDTLVGGTGNDTIRPGTNPDSTDVLLPTQGNDTYDLTGAGATSFYQFNHADTTAAITVTIDGVANTGTITAAGQYTDTILGTAQGLGWGLGFIGSNFGDTFTANLESDGADGNWVDIVGNGGADAYNLTFNNGGTARLTFLSGANQGVVLDATTGVVTNDGQGFAETIVRNGTGGRLELRGTDFIDDMTGSAGSDSFISEQGSDSIDGGAGFDRVRYDRSGVDAMDIDLTAGTASGTWDGNAFTDGLTSIEWVRGSRTGDDTISGSSEDERFEGRGGNDTLVGLDGDDTLEGGDDDDFVNGGVGSNVMDGGDGDDTVSFESDTSGVTIYLRWGDVIRVSENDTALNFENVIGGAGNDRLIGSNDANVIIGGAGNDIIKSKDGGGVSFGEEGNDTIKGNGLDESIDGGDNDDALSGNGGDDTVLGRDGNDTVNGNGGNDLLEGNGGADKVQGGKGNDTLKGGGDTDRLIGGRGNDSLEGGNGLDYLVGDNGNDTLVGNAGDDRLTGGGQADLFIFGIGDGYDRIKDWEDGTDQVDISAFALGDINGVNAIATQTGSGVRLDFASGERLLFEGINQSDLSTDDFMF